MPVERESFTRTEIRAGIMVLLSGAVLVLFIAAILNYRPRGETKDFDVMMNNTEGLGVGADVRFGGMLAGRVTSIAPERNDRSLMVVRARVAASTPVNAESRAYVSQVTLTSEKHLEITTGTADAPLLASGARIASTTGGLFGDLPALTETVTDLLEDIQVILGVSGADGQPVLDAGQAGTLTEALDTLDGLMADMRVLLGVVDEKGNLIIAEDQPTFTDVVSNVDQAIKDGDALLRDVRSVVDENRETIRDVLETVEELGNSADRTLDELNALIADNRDTVDATLEETREAVSRINALSADMTQLVASLREILDYNQPVLNETIDNLNETLRNLEALTETLKDQPQSIIRGREPVGRQ